MKYISRIVICVIVLLTITTVLFAETVKFQHGLLNQYGYSSVQDTYIDIDNQYLNYGAAPELFVCGNDDGYHWYHSHALIRFGVTGLNATPIQSARLYLYVKAQNPMPHLPDEPLGYAGYGAAPMFYEDRDWAAGQGNGTSGSPASCFAWKKNPPSGPVPWVNSPLGGWWTGEWYNFTATGRNAEGYHEICAELPVELVNSWTTTAQNPGLRLYFGDTFGYIASSNSPYQELRPLLEVTMVPEPSSMIALLAGFSGLFAIRRRYR